MKVRCPTCERSVEWSEEAPYRPFCSDRCRIADLGAWVAGDRAIPGESVEIDPSQSTDESDTPHHGSPRDRQ